MNSAEKTRHFLTPAQMPPKSKVAPNEKVAEVGLYSRGAGGWLRDLNHHGPDGPRSRKSQRNNQQ
jgi:hypothetical protein